MPGDRDPHASVHASDASFRDLFVSNPVPMFIYARDGLRILDGNEAAAREYGYTHQAFLTMRLEDLLLPEDRWRLAERHREPHTGFARVGLRRHVRADGAVIHVEIERLDLAYQGVPAALVTVIDTTGKIEATRQLLEAKQHLAVAQRLAHAGSFERDLGTGAVLWTEETYRIMGRDPATPAPSRDELLAMIHPDDRPLYEANMRKSEEGEAPSPIDYRIPTARGGIRWIHTHAETVKDKDGKPWKRIGTFQDVTEWHDWQERQRLLESSLRVAIDTAEEARREAIDANVELERRVEERTAELRRAQMTLVTQERLSALGQLTATVAHEMRNPLSAIRNTIFVIEEMGRANGLPFERPLARMARSIARCEDIISDLLDFTRAREPKLVPVCLDDWLAELLDELAVPPGIALERELGADGVVVSLDADRFRRVLINLVDNASQAIEGAETAERRITVTTTAAPMPEIRVADTGPGIAPDVLPKIFEPLFSTKSFGTGLGLPTVRQIVEQHGGTIAVESEGRGATVRIALPLTGVRARAPLAAAG
jgi:PAS domain S-box-containing protein